MPLSSCILQWLTHSDLVAREIFSITLWKTWKARNNVIFNKGKFNPILVASSALDFLDEFNKANPKEGNSSWGMLIRDHQGSVLYAATNSENVQISPTLAEATEASSLSNLHRRFIVSAMVKYEYAKPQEGMGSYNLSMSQLPSLKSYYLLKYTE
ncbi:hypothetical protein TSUD_302620 [Trifolium subterraneum]|uniref:Uncharacterized protein n=1 Tax=Trifolium subterraneum TaxID=3900 RepID=A0A2Z6NHX0_TRISU|nr:hypothetical protein TSUD_302620 [Trifolium subterraneum]